MFYLILSLCPPHDKLAKDITKPKPAHEWTLFASVRWGFTQEAERWRSTHDDNRIAVFFLAVTAVIVETSDKRLVPVIRSSDSRELIVAYKETCFKQSQGEGETSALYINAKRSKGPGVGYGRSFLTFGNAGMISQDPLLVETYFERSIISAVNRNRKVARSVIRFSPKKAEQNCQQMLLYPYRFEVHLGSTLLQQLTRDRRYDASQGRLDRFNVWQSCVCRKSTAAD